MIRNWYMGGSLKVLAMFNFLISVVFLKFIITFIYTINYIVYSHLRKKDRGM